MNKIVKRFTGPTPPFWTKVRNIATIIAAAAGSIAAYELANPGSIPAKLLTTCQVIAAVAAAIATTAQLTSSNE